MLTAEQSTDSFLEFSDNPLMVIIGQAAVSCFYINLPRHMLIIKNGIKQQENVISATERDHLFWRWALIYRISVITYFRIFSDHACLKIG